MEKGEPLVEKGIYMLYINSVVLEEGNKLNYITFSIATIVYDNLFSDDEVNSFLIKIFSKTLKIDEKKVAIVGYNFLTQKKLEEIENYFATSSTIH